MKIWKVKKRISNKPKEGYTDIITSLILQLVSFFLYLAGEQYLRIIGPSKASAMATLCPRSLPMKEKFSGKQSKFAPAATASYTEKKHIMIFEKTDRQASIYKHYNRRFPM